MRKIPKIISVAFEGVGGRIRADVSSKAPTQEQLNQLELEALNKSHAEWFVKSIYKIGDEIRIEFWNGNLCTAFRPLYLIEKMEEING